jgi:hypothetical protein
MRRNEEMGKMNFLGTVGLAAAILAALPFAAGAQAPTAPKRPDFNGIWMPGAAPPPAPRSSICAKSVDAFANDAVDRFNANNVKGAGKWITFEQDCGIQRRGRVSKPLYKPAYWEEVRKRDLLANAGGEHEQYADPQWLNIPVGVPRLGPPNQIAQIGEQMFFLYENQNQFRSVPTDCREHDPVLKYDQTVNGQAVGCWEGETLVVTSMGFTDQTWLDWPGYMHSNEMTVIERFRRDGDVLIYQVTVDDPVMFLQPWTQPPARLTLNKTPGAQLMQDVPYIDRSLGKLADPNYRG